MTHSANLFSGCLNFVRGYFGGNARLAAHHAFRLLARNGTFSVVLILLDV